MLLALNKTFSMKFRIDFVRKEKDLVLILLFILFIPIQ